MAARRSSARPPSLDERLEAGVLVLDGAVGTELERRGTHCELPLWSAHALLEAPALVEQIHADYAAAGADLLTANTFRTQRRTLARQGLDDRAEDLTRRAVELARSGARATPGRPALLVVGSAPTLEDCYRPDLVPDPVTLEREHVEHARNLAIAGVDAIWVETMNSLGEATAAARAARATGLPFCVSFVCWQGPRLLSGEWLATALAAVLPTAPLAFLVNCLPPSNVRSCLPVLRDAGLPFGVYANLGAPTDESAGNREEECSPAEFAEEAAGWLAAGARLVGGCCGTTPDHIRAVADRVHASDAGSRSHGR